MICIEQKCGTGETAYRDERQYGGEKIHPLGISTERLISHTSVNNS